MARKSSAAQPGSEPAERRVPTWERVANARITVKHPDNAEVRRSERNRLIVAELKLLLEERAREHNLTAEEVWQIAGLLEMVLNPSHASVADLYSLPAKPVPEPPENAPELWAERDLNRRENVAEFIDRVYAPWMPEGFERKLLSELDLPCYKALSVFLTRHPDHPLATRLHAQSQTTKRLIEVLSQHFSLDDLRRVGYAIDSQFRRAQKQK